MNNTLTNGATLTTYEDSKVKARLGCTFCNTLTGGSIAACLPSSTEQYSILRSFISDYYSEGLINNYIAFAAFLTSRDAVMFIEFEGKYTAFYTQYFSSYEYPQGWVSQRECFLQCITTLEALPEAKHHNDALFNALKKYAESAPILSSEDIT